MNLLAIITAVLTLLAGIGVFMIACTMMSSNLESASSKRLKHNKKAVNRILDLPLL